MEIVATKTQEHTFIHYCITIVELNVADDILTIVAETILETSKFKIKIIIIWDWPSENELLHKGWLTWVAIPAWSQPGFHSVVFPVWRCLFDRGQAQYETTKTHNIASREKSGRRMHEGNVAITTLWNIRSQWSPFNDMASIMKYVVKPESSMECVLFS